MVGAATRDNRRKKICNIIYVHMKVDEPFTALDVLDRWNVSEGHRYNSEARRKRRQISYHEGSKIVSQLSPPLEKLDKEKGMTRNVYVWHGEDLDPEYTRDKAL